MSALRGWTWLRGENRSATLVVDLGHEITGYPPIELDGVAGGIVDLGVGESLANGRVTPARNELHGNRYIMKQGLQAWEAFEWDGFRYLQLTIRNCPQPVTLHKVAVNFTSYPVGQGTYSMSSKANARGGSMTDSGKVVYRLRVRIVRVKGPHRLAYLPAEKEPVVFGVHSKPTPRSSQ